MLFGYILGQAMAGFLISFIITGLCWLIAWRKNPVWRARFWWVTFALAGVLTIGCASGQRSGEHMASDFAGIILFVVALTLKKN
jgi:biotin transporter BioY